MNANLKLGCIGLLLLGGCGTLVDFVPADPLTVRAPRSPAEVQLYLHSVPACPYQEIGHIEVSTYFSRSSEVLELIREEAAVRGADAAIVVEHREGHQTAHAYTAVAVAFPEALCTQAVQVLK